MQPDAVDLWDTLKTINSVSSNSVSFKYQRFPPSGCKDIEIIKFDFLTKIQFLYSKADSFQVLYLCSAILITISFLSEILIIAI